LESGYKNDPNAPSKAEMEKQAADIVRRTMPTYSEAPAWVRNVLAALAGNIAPHHVHYRGWPGDGGNNGSR
jgi:hypothetical protein